MRQQLVAGNWKMNKNLQEGLQLAREVIQQAGQYNQVTVLLAPPYIHLPGIFEMLGGNANLKLAAQNCHDEAHGAYTGEVSASMLSSVGCSHVIIGHSERRQYAGETDAILARKVDRVLENDLVPIFCCGEDLQQRESDKHQEVVQSQLSKGLYHLSSEDMAGMIIAYEPVWAIGTGKTASPEQAQEMHAFIRQSISDRYGSNVAQQVTILYGGSCNPGNAKELFAMEDVDGGLIGGASLKASDFSEVIQALHP